MYGEMVAQLRATAQNGIATEGEIDEAIRRVHRLKTDEDYVETGGDLRSRWRGWARHLLLAVSRLSEPDGGTSVEAALSEEQWNNSEAVLAKLQALFFKGSVRGA